MMTRLLLLLCLGLSPLAAESYLKAFPDAAEGQVRHVIDLAEEKHEQLLRVQLLVGKTVDLDEQNRYFFAGQLKAENVEGWGFTKYTLDKLGPMAGTRMMVPPNAKKVPRFITLGGDPFLIRYNSKLPVVVYLPKGVELRYRIWRAGEVQRVGGAS